MLFEEEPQLKFEFEKWKAQISQKEMSQELFEDLEYEWLYPTELGLS